jgi:glycosyltransferase involved in cell wall biosynthesis
MTRLLHAFSTFTVGGAQSRFIRLSRCLGDNFHHVVTATDGRYDAARLIGNGVSFEVAHVPATRGRNLNNVPRFAAALRKLSPDRLVTYNFGSIEWAFANVFCRLPHVHVEDGFGPDEAEGPFLRRSILRALAFRLSRSVLVTVSEPLSQIARGKWWVPPDRIKLIPNGIDVYSGPLISERQRRSRFSENGEVVIGTVAGLRPEKRIDRLLHAVSLFPEDLAYKLVIAGDGALGSELRALASELGIAENIQFLGHVDDVLPLYSEFDVFALSSDTEQLPLALLEAMAAGLPVASTDVGDIRHVVSADNQAWLCGRDAKHLSQVLLQIIESPQHRHEVGDANSRIVRDRYNSSAMNQAWRNVLSGDSLDEPTSAPR